MYSSRADLARNLGIPRARVTQLLNLLKIHQELFKLIITLGDPMSSPIVTERKLRLAINHSNEQKKFKI